MNKLKALFDNCDWNNKTFGRWPEKHEEILYQWHEYEHELARLFFKDTGAMILTDDDPVVMRHLYYIENDKGIPMLCVTQREKPIDLEAAAANMAMMLDPTKVQESLDRVMNRQTPKKQP